MTVHASGGDRPDYVEGADREETMNTEPEREVVHNFPRESLNEHVRERSCPCNPREIPWGDAGEIMVIHRRPPKVERRRFKELFGDRRSLFTEPGRSQSGA